ncbi:type II toxin-antitoxin system HicA family toxin [Candidatus Peregrinibacteria bacterium]|nr:type II toxin-antitoxin system HicA family toxin [Candidatus Peregrinibacteria bacterium]
MRRTRGSAALRSISVVTGKELVRVVRKFGWDTFHIRGSHHQLKHRKIGNKITVPVHGNRELKRGILRAILKEIDVSVERLRKSFE